MSRAVYMTSEAFKKQNEGIDLPYAENTSVLAGALSIGSKKAANRLACQAMEGCDGKADGTPDELTLRRYDRFAKGGAGIIWFEATAVMREARANPRQLWIREGNLDSFKAIVHDTKETCLKTNGYEPIIIMQATHSGRYSKPNGTPAPLIAYSNPVFEGDNPIASSRIVSDEYIDSVKDALVSASKLAEKAGFDGVDIKCCHRYLNSELLSAYNRPGRYGGSIENRTRLLRESISGAMQVCSNDFIVSSRLNIYDGFAYPYGFGIGENGTEFDAKEPVWLLKELEKLGVELLNITMGNPYFNPHVNRPFATGKYTPEEHPLLGVARMLNGTAELKKAVPQITLICSALSYLGAAAPHVAAAFIERGGFDAAGFGRTVFANPNFARDIISTGELDKSKLCICCSKCSDIMRAGGTPGCVIHDKEVYMPIYKKYCGGDSK